MTAGEDSEDTGAELLADTELGIETDGLDTGVGEGRETGTLELDTAPTGELGGTSEEPGEELGATGGELLAEELGEMVMAVPDPLGRVKVSVGNDWLGVLEGITASTEVDELTGVEEAVSTTMIEDEMVTVNSEFEELGVEPTTGDDELELVTTVTLRVDVSVVAGATTDETGETGELNSSVQVVSYVTDEVTVALLGVDDGETGDSGLETGTEELITGEELGGVYVGLGAAELELDAMTPLPGVLDVCGADEALLAVGEDAGPVDRTTDNVDIDVSVIVFSDCDAVDSRIVLTGGV